MLPPWPREVYAKTSTKYVHSFVPVRLIPDIEIIGFYCRVYSLGSPSWQLHMHHHEFDFVHFRIDMRPPAPPGQPSHTQPYSKCPAVNMPSKDCAKIEPQCAHITEASCKKPGSLKVVHSCCSYRIGGCHSCCSGGYLNDKCCPSGLGKCPA